MPEVHYSINQIRSDMVSIQLLAPTTEVINTKEITAEGYRPIQQEEETNLTQDADYKQWLYYHYKRRMRLSTVDPSHTARLGNCSV